MKVFKQLMRLHMVLGENISVSLLEDVCVFCLFFGWSHSTVDGPANL